MLKHLAIVLSALLIWGCSNNDQGSDTSSEPQNQTAAETAEPSSTVPTLEMVLAAQPEEVKARFQYRHPLYDQWTRENDSLQPHFHRHPLEP